MLFSALQDALIQKSLPISSKNVILEPYSTNMDPNEIYFLPLLDEKDEKDEVDEDIIESKMTKLYFVAISILGIYLLHKMLTKTKI